MAEGGLFDNIEFANSQAESSTEPSNYGPLIEDDSRLIDSKASLHNSSGEVILDVPNPELIKLLHEADNRIEAFTYEIPPSYDRDAEGRLSIKSLGEVQYNQLVSEPLARKIAKDFPQEEYVVARGISCSVNGTLKSEGLLVRDIREVVNIGDEQGRDSTLAGNISWGDGKPEMHYRVNQYLFDSAWSLRRSMSEGRENIFPVLLLLDKSKLTSGNKYSVKLPEDKTERSKTVVKAYVLPRVSDGF